VVDVRPLRRGDREGLAAAVTRLSDQSRYLRFATGKPRLTKRELDFLVNIDHHRHEAIVAIDPSTGRGVAIVRYIEVAGEPDVAEVAATVTDDWQGRGLGTALLAQLAARARDEGYSAFRASVLASNQRVIAMLLAAGFAPFPSGGGLREYELALTQPRAGARRPPTAPSSPNGRSRLRQVTRASPISASPSKCAETRHLSHDYTYLAVLRALLHRKASARWRAPKRGRL
jgi:GNAT superfamily N-acetyltransferase